MNAARPAAGAPKPPRRLTFVVRLAGTGLLLAGLFLWLPWRQIVDVVSRVPAVVWGTTVAGFLAGHAVSALKWRWLLAACGVHVGIREVMRAHAAGLFANLFLPSLVGGDVIRAGLATRAAGRLEAVAVGTVADRAVDTAAIGVLIAGAVAFLPGPTEATARLVAIVAFLALLAGAVALVLGTFVLVLERLPRKIREPVRRVKAAALALGRHRGRAAAAVLAAVSVQAAFVGLNVRVGEAMGLTLPLAAWFFTWPLAKLATLVPVSLGGIGVREVVLAALMAPFAVEASLAAGQALVWDGVLVVGGLAAGLFSLWAPRGGKLRHGVSKPKPAHSSSSPSS